MERQINKLLSRFKDGNKRYHNSPLFNTTITSLAHGEDPLVIIDELMQITESVQKNFEEYMEHTQLPIVVRVEKEEIGEHEKCPECKAKLKEKFSGVECSKCNYFKCF